jgi:hypothetical protein
MRTSVRALKDRFRVICRQVRKAGKNVYFFWMGALLFARGAGLPDVIIFFGWAPGDDLLCTAVLRELQKRGRGTIWMISNFPQLYSGNGDAARVLPAGADYRGFSNFWRCDFYDLPDLDYAPFDQDDRSEPPRRHIIAEMCAGTGIVGSVDIKPYLRLTDVEKRYGKWAKNSIVIQSGGLATIAPMLNKQWYPDRFQEVVDVFRNEYELVQLGGTADPALEGVKDLRGATDIRQSAAILQHARLYIGTVGFLMHLARAAECPGVIVYGGREAPWQSGYICNANLYTAVPCAPCWRWNRCDNNRQCMKAISADDVVNAAREVLARPRNPLTTEQVVIS